MRLAGFFAGVVRFLFCRAGWCPLVRKSRRVNLKPPGHCIFCGNAGLSKEHVWSDWLKQIHPRGSQHFAEHGGGFEKVSDFSGPQRRPIIYKGKQGSLLGTKVRIVCENCNSGWMSEIVDKAKPPLIRIFRGEQVTLDGEDQKNIAGWIALTSITAQYISRDQKFVSIPAWQRRFLLKNGYPPDEWSICLGQYLNPRRYFFRSHAWRSTVNDLFGKVPVDPSMGDNCYLPTYTIGNLFVQALETELPIISVMYEKWVNSDILIRVWPRQRYGGFWPLPFKGTKWPPPTPIEDSLIEPLSDAFYLKLSTPKTL